MIENREEKKNPTTNKRYGSPFIFQFTRWQTMISTTFHNFFDIPAMLENYCKEEDLPSQVGQSFIVFALFFSLLVNLGLGLMIITHNVSKNPDFRR